MRSYNTKLEELKTKETPETKACAVCLTIKPLTEFGKGQRKGRQYYCKKCTHVYHIKRVYGLNRKQYLSMRQDQDNKCAICGTEESRLVVDHCHKTGMIRALLCDKCNVSLGNFQDDPNLLRKAATYLESYNDR